MHVDWRLKHNIANAQDYFSDSFYTLRRTRYDSAGFRDVNMRRIQAPEIVVPGPNPDETGPGTTSIKNA